MPYTVNWSTNCSAQIDSQPYGVSRNTNYVISSSNAIQQTVTNLTGSVYTQLSTGSLQNVSAIAIFNDNTVVSSSVVLICTGSSGGNVLSNGIQPGLSAQIPWTGSLNGLYATVVGGAGTATIQYTLFQA